MKKIKVLALVMVTIMVVTSFVGCKDKDTLEKNNETASLAAEVFADVEPLSEELPVNIGLFTGSVHAVPSVVIEKLGGYEYANLDHSFESFGSGPILIESMIAGAVDIGTFGVGGVHSGTITHGTVSLGANSPDFDSLRIFAKNDSEIVKAGKNPETGMYGTKEMWKGKEIFVPIGSTLYYVLAKGLESIGLTLDDVKVTHMAVENTNTALRAGQCEIGGLWSTLSYGDINEEFTPVITAGGLGLNMVNNYVTSQEILANPKKVEALQKWMELYYVAVDWTFASEENFAQTIDWFIEYCEENGVKTSHEEAEILCKAAWPYTIEEAYEIATTESPISGMSNFVYYSYEPLEFYVTVGNYEEEDLDTFRKPEYANISLLENVYNKRYGK